MNIFPQVTRWHFFTGTSFMAKMQSCSISSSYSVALELEFSITVRIIQ